MTADYVRDLARMQLDALEQAAELIAKPARDAGFECFARMFLIADGPVIDGVHWPLVGPLRYTLRQLARDHEQVPEGFPVGFSFVVRYASPDTPEGAAEIAFHKKAAELEREGLGGGK